MSKHLQPAEPAPRHHRRRRRIVVVIPARDEETALPLVLDDLPPDPPLAVIVVDNGSTDGTAAVARSRGARVLSEPRPGYGRACRKALADIAADPPDIVVFLDGDHSDHPEEIPALLEPLLAGEADLVIGSRTRGRPEPGALLPHARLGNRLATALIRILFGHRYSDLGPMRAIDYRKLAGLEMADPTYGWTVEMQVKAVRKGLRIREVPVGYRVRVGTSKVSGTMYGSLAAGCKILMTIFRLYLSRD